MTKIRRGALLALMTLSQLVLVGCTASPDFSDTAFSCTDGECPADYSCIQSMCVSDPSGDAGIEVDAFLSPDAMPQAACDDLFGQAPGYQLCSEDAVSCSFNVALLGETCTAACERLETTCLDAFENEDIDLCAPLVSDDTCDSARQSQICVCARPE